MDAKPCVADNKEVAETQVKVERLIKECLTDLTPPQDGKRGRPVVMPTAAVWAGMLLAVLHGDGSQRGVWRLLADFNLVNIFGRVEVSEDAVYKRLKKLGQDTFLKLFAHVTQLLQNMPSTKAIQNSLAPFAGGVFAIDAMTLERVKKCLPVLRDIEKAVLPGKLLALFDLRAQLWKHIEFRESATENDKHSVRDLLAYLPARSLILADLGFFSFEWFDELTNLGHFWLSRMRAKTSYTILHTYYAQAGVLDAIVWLGAYRADRAAHAVRLIEFQSKGKTFSYITNVLSPSQLSITEAAALYGRRWDIEMMFNLVKTHLGLHVMWSAHKSVVLHQVYAVFTVAQIILGLRSEIAYQTKADVFEVSLGLLVRETPKLMFRGVDPVAYMVEYGRRLLYIRPSTRTKLNIPAIDTTAYIPLSPEKQLIRLHRYAKKT